MNDLDLVLDWEQASAFARKHGDQATFDALKSKTITSGWHKGKTIAELRPYQMSTDWIRSSKYICKVKGGLGDIIIGWAQALTAEEA